VLAFTYVIHFFTYEFASLGAGRFALTFIFAGSVDGLFVRHKASLRQIIPGEVNLLHRALPVISSGKILMKPARPSG
jgi:hypothetical protein